MQANKSILIGGGIIIFVGAIHAAIQKKPETPVFAGGIGFLLLASLLDAFGGGWARFAGGLTWLAVVTVLTTDGASLVTALQNTQKKGATK